MTVAHQEAIAMALYCLLLVGLSVRAVRIHRRGDIYVLYIPLFVLGVALGVWTGMGHDVQGM